MSTFEIWAYPTGDRSIDHTFVRCKNNMKTFKCWGGSGMSDPDTVKITSASYSNAYNVANCYRTPQKYFGKNYPDTAGVGVYGANGVCHQSANLFYYAVSSSPMKEIRDKHNVVRPRGLWASYLGFGAYGSLTPFFIWKWDYYDKCKNTRSIGEFEQFSLSDFFANPLAWIRQWLQTFRFQSFLRTLERLHEQAKEEKLPAWDIQAHEFRALGNHLSRGVDLSSFQKTHSELHKERHDMLKADWDESPAIGETLAEKMNDWNVLAQQELEKEIGTAAYEQLTGLPAGQYYRPVDPQIASGLS